MTTPIEEGEEIVPVPLFPPKSIEERLYSFSETVYTADPSTHLYKFVDALCGDAGAGNLRKELTTARLNQSLDSLRFRDLDTLFSGSFQLNRLVSETYDYNPVQGMYTSDEWDEMRTKDSWYRERCKDFVAACNAGGTPQGFRLMVRSAIGTDCDLFEVWRYIDEYGLKGTLGRTGLTLRNEIVVKPHKSPLSQKEKYLVVKALDRIRPMDCIVTVDEQGLAVNTLITPRSVGADSSYFEVQKEVTGSPDIAKIPPPEFLAEDIDPSENWLKPGLAVRAPNIAHGTSQEHSYYYNYSATGTSAIDTILYQKDTGNGVLVKETNYARTVQNDLGWGPWLQYELADSPDNFPGGKYGQHPDSAPALNSNGDNYQFPYPSQQDYVTEMMIKIQSEGGQADNTRYRLPVSSSKINLTIWTPTNVIPLEVPTIESTVISPWVSRAKSLSNNTTQSLYAGR
ncbi:DUF7297 family protein [Streptomyces sp. CoH17]|uniref:DUF7297 family protein n=1 Tax=Streptomyces sp. CoH17 TaxID=2992806 RepID=UPI00226F796D|nr:hypothetical protein [Streptomyces sp. CoH17]